MTSPSVLYAADERVDMQVNHRARMAMPDLEHCCLQPIIDQMRSMLGQEKGKIYWDVLRRQKAVNFLAALRSWTALAACEVETLRLSTLAGSC